MAAPLALGWRGLMTADARTAATAAAATTTPLVSYALRHATRSPAHPPNDTPAPRRTRVQRNLDKLHQKEVVPAVDRTEAVPPPCMVAVMGPKGCGKSTLIRSLVKVRLAADGVEEGQQAAQRGRQPAWWKP